MIPKRSYPLLVRLRKAGARPLSLAEDATEVIEVHPEEKSIVPPVFMLDRDRARVTAAQHETTLEAEWRRVEGGETLHAATVRYVFRDVLATPFGFYTRRAGHQQTGAVSLSKLLGLPITRMVKGYFGQPAIAGPYFGHWLRDAIPSTLLARPDETLYLPQHDGWAHVDGYAERLGLPPLSDGIVHYEEMSFCMDLGMNADRRRRTREIYDRVQDRCGRSDAKGLYISRGQTGARRMIANESELVDALTARGFATVSATDPLETIWKKGGGVPQVVTMEGSHWAHAFYLAGPGALHVTINPADRFNNNYTAYMPAVGHRLGTVVAPRQGDDYIIDVPSVLEVLDRAGQRS